MSNIGGISNNYRNNVNTPLTEKMKLLNIKYQVHHLISKSALKKSGKKSFLETNGYNINRAENLESYPCELKGACHLKVQLHRGNHGEQDNFLDDDNDNEHPRNYHDNVMELLLKELDKLKEHEFCASKKDQEELEKVLDKLSKKIKIYIARYKFTLTSIAETFKDGEKGCANHDSITKFINEKDSNIMCDKNRIHY